MDALPRIEMEQIKEEKDNDVKNNNTQKYETTVSKLDTDINDGNLPVQGLSAEKVNVYLCSKCKNRERQRVSCSVAQMYLFLFYNYLKQSNDHLKKTNQQIQSLEQPKVKNII